MDSEKNNIAERLPPLWQAFLERLHEVEHAIDRVCYGVVQLTENSAEQLDHYAAIEVRSAERVPAEMVRLDIAASPYARFEHRGDVRLLNNTVNYVYSSWLLNANRRHTCGPDLEIYGDGYRADSADSVIHYAIPVADESDAQLSGDLRRHAD